MPKIHPYTRNAIRDIIPYEPGKPISEVQREYGLAYVIKLASNENPLGPSPKAVEAIKEALGELNLYPDGSCYNLKKKLSERLNVSSSQLIIGNGSAEIIELICEAFIDVGDEAVIGRQAFFKYRIAVQIMNGTIIWAEMPDNTYNADEILAKVSGKTKVLFIANPNNPTGTMMDKDQVAYMMDRLPEDVIVVFDEAYYDYQNDTAVYPDTMEYLRQGRSVIILRTFSKSYGLAGLRIGYAITTEGIAHSMNGVREAFNVNSLAQVAAIAALDDDEFLDRSIKLNEKGKMFFYKRLERLDLEYRPTAANFILIKVPIPGRELFKLLLKKGVVVRPVDGYGLPEYIRVSIGLPDENRRFFSSLEEVLRELNH
jgi:histidinol-phosphate aminotransferase